MIEIDKKEIENKLWPEDIDLFANMEGNYISNNEKLFFETLYVKMQTECAPCREALLIESENEDHIFFLRDGYDEFILGSSKDGIASPVLHTMKLKDVLDANLKSLGLVDSDITLQQWLRNRDYQGLVYNRNNAYL